MDTDRDTNPYKLKEEDVAEKLGVSCNRKFVKKVLDERRKSQLEKKLSKIS
jgi:hypothetical protein